MYQRHEFGLAGGGAAFAPARLPARAAGAFGGPFGGRAPVRSAPAGLVVDLAGDIGSARWWRGLGTLSLLCLTAAWFAPAIEPRAAGVPAPYGDAQWEQARALGIAPLALGADMGVGMDARMAPTDAVRAIEHAPERPSIDLLATLGRGDGFVHVLERSGVGGAEAAHVASIVGAVANLAAIRPGTPVDIRLGSRPAPYAARPLIRLGFRAALDLDVVVEREAGRLVLRAIPIATDDTPLRIGGRVGGSLYFSARAAGASPRAIGAYLRTLAAQGPGGVDLGPDDRFDLIVSNRRTDAGESESGELLYAGLDRASGRDLQLLPWTQGGRTTWFEASGVGRTSGSLSQPVAGSISSGFGPRRHPILGFVRMHRGVDFRAHYGQPIYAATNGQVVRAGWAGGYGRQVRIAHGGGLMTSYSHMSRIVAEPGAPVRQGQVIGYVGSTGLSTGPHLHYELYRNGVAINPMSVRFVTRSLLEGAELEAFRARLREMLAVRTGVPGRGEPI